VNGISSSLQSLVMLISPILSGTLLSFSSIVLVFFIDVVTAAAIAVIIMLSLKTSKRSLPRFGKKQLFSGYARGIQIFMTMHLFGYYLFTVRFILSWSRHWLF
jgi:DHA3 family macrolide efflux protein-like MFS transporter